MVLKDVYLGNKEQRNKNFSQKLPVVSFEVFPPKNDVDGSKLEKLLEHLKILKKYNPAFVSLTYGAGGTTQNASFNMIKKIKKNLDLDVMPHYTCVGSSKKQIENYLQEIQNLGIKSILALRGDVPEGMEQLHFDFNYANELVEFIKSKTNLSVSVAGYPECHVDCSDLFLDLENLKKKVNAGAEVIYTQMFFDNDKFFSFVQLVRDKGIEAPIIPGILPITNFNQLERMLSMAKVTVPKPLMSRLEKYKDNPEDIKKIGIEFASYQCQQLMDSEVKGLHFYTLNTSSSVGQILENLGVS